MHSRLIATMAALILAVCPSASAFAQTPPGKNQQPGSTASKEAAPEGSTSLATKTRTVLLKMKVSGNFREARLGDILKEWADEIDMRGEEPVMWAYGLMFPYDRKITFACQEKPLDVVLDQLLTKAGDGLGYVVVAKAGDKYDGWVRLTTTGERGIEKAAAAPAPDEENSAAEKLTLAKKLIALGNPKAAKPVLEILVKNYPKTKAATEAQQLLEKMDK